MATSLAKLRKGRGLAAVAVLTAAPSCAQDWPQLLGPGRDGVYTGAAKAPSKLAWKRPIGEGFSSPVVAQGKLIVFHRQGSEEIVEAWNTESGARIWRYAYPTAYRDSFGFNEGPRAAPLIDNGKVYTYGAEGKLHCLNLADGKKVWSEDVMERFQVRKGFFGAASGPVISGSLLLLNAGGAKGGIIAFDKNTGRVAWTATQDEASYSSPRVAMLGGVEHALFLTRAGFVDLDPATGKVNYTMPWRSRSEASVNAATPVVAGNVVFLSASYGTGAIALELTKTGYRKLWSNDDSLSNHYATSVYRDGYLYGFDGRQEMGQELRCVELRTGKVRWSQSGMRAGTVTLAGDVLLVLKENGELLIVKADPAGYSMVSRHALLEGTVRSYPAWAEGRVFLRSEDTIASYVLR